MGIHGLKGELDRETTSRSPPYRTYIPSDEMLSDFNNSFFSSVVEFMKQTLRRSFLDTFVFIAFFREDLGIQSFLIKSATATLWGVVLMVQLAGVEIFDPNGSL